jgi:hypothetical protein
MPHQNVNPVDSSLFADGFSLAQHHRDAWPMEIQRVRAIRGDIMAAMFEVEAEIDWAIGDLLLPFRRSVRSPAWLHARHRLLQNEVLTRFDLRTKCEVLAALMLRRFPEQRKEIDVLGSTLKRVRTVRNAMAHCPVTFKALERQSAGSWFRPYVMTSRGDVHLSGGYVATFKKDALLVIGSTRAILKKGLRVDDPRSETL